MFLDIPFVLHAACAAQVAGDWCFTLGGALELAHTDEDALSLGGWQVVDEALAPQADDGSYEASEGRQRTCYERQGRHCHAYDT